MVRYGGHAGAAGCTVSSVLFSSFSKALLQQTEQLYALQEFFPVLHVDTLLDLSKITPQFVQSIESLRPF